MKFSSRVAGRVSGVRFYKSTRNVGPHVGQLWGPHGRLLAKVRFARTTRSGWQTAHFSHPVRITPHRRYVASYTAPNGHYAGDTNALSFARPKVTRYLVAWQGVYAYGSRMPTHNWRASNYYVDVVFSATTKAKPGPVRMPVRTQGSRPAPATPSAPVTDHDRPAALGRLDHRQARCEQHRCARRDDADPVRRDADDPGQHRGGRQGHQRLGRRSRRAT